MKRTEVIQLRVSPEHKQLIKSQGNMTAYILGLVEKDLGLREETLDPLSERGKAAWREAVKQGEHEVEVQDKLNLESLITQLKGQGMTTRVATQEAKKRLGL